MRFPSPQLEKQYSNWESFVVAGKIVIWMRIIHLKVIIAKFLGKGYTQEMENEAYQEQLVPHPRHIDITGEDPFPDMVLI